MHSEVNRIMGFWGPLLRAIYYLAWYALSAIRKTRPQFMLVWPRAVICHRFCLLLSWIEFLGTARDGRGSVWRPQDLILASNQDPQLHWGDLCVEQVGRRSAPPILRPWLGGLIVESSPLGKELKYHGGLIVLYWTIVVRESSQKVKLYILAFNLH